MPGALRVVRRPKGQAPRRESLTAAAQPITDASQMFKPTAGVGVGAVSNAWQETAWEMLDLVGELRYYVGWAAAACSRVKLIASELDDDGVPTGKCDNDRVKQIVKAIAGGRLGQSQVVKRLVPALKVPGEVWVAIVMGLPDGPPAGTWLPLSRDEIMTKGKVVTIILPDGTKHDLDLTGDDSLFRIWDPRPRRAYEPDSAVRAALDPLHEIVRTTKTIANASKSRLIGNGIVLVPQEMSLPTQATPVSANKPGDPAIPAVNTPAVTQLQELLFQVAQTAYDDPDSMAALIPIFAGVPAETIKAISHVKFDNEVTVLAIQTRNDAITRLAMALDVSPERLLGLGSSTNHWSAWQIGDTDVQLHISPVMELICAAITKYILKIVFEREGIDPDKYVLWYDPSGLTSDPDKSDQASDAFDRGAINAEAYREFLNLGDSGYDFGTLKGWQQWASDRVSQNPELITSLMPLLPTVLQGMDFPVPTAALPPAPADNTDVEDDDSETQNDGSPGSETSPPPSERETRSVVGGTEMTMVERMLVTRALELAGKRRVTRADRGRLASYKPHEYHRMMPPVDPDKIPDLIRGWDAALEDDVITMMGVDVDTMKDRVRAEVRRQLTAQVVNA